MKYHNQNIRHIIYHLVVIKNLGIFLVICMLASSCRYYKTNYKTTDVSEIKTAQSTSKNIILHYGQQIWQLKNVEVNTIQQKILGKIHQLQSQQLEFCSDKEGVRRYRKRIHDALNDFHLYTNEIAITADSNVIVPISAIHLIAENKMSKSSNFASKAFVGVSGILVAIILYLNNEREY